MQVNSSKSGLYGWRLSKENHHWGVVWMLKQEQQLDTRFI